MRIFIFLATLLAILPLSLVAQDSFDSSRDKWIIKSTNQSLKDKGILPFSYRFHDNDYRHLSVEFIGPNKLSISNLAGEKRTFLFSDVYNVHFESKNKIIVIDSLMYTTRQDSIDTDIIPPFDYQKDYKYCNSIFKTLPSGTKIRLSHSYQDLSINDFIFHIRSFTDDEFWEVMVWRMKQARKENK